MLQLTDLTAKIGKKELFINRSFNFDYGKIEYIAGENGKGKTTLLQIIRGNTTHFSELSGQLIFNNKSYDLTKQDRPLIGYVIQQYRQMLIPSFTVEQNIAAARMKAHPGFSLLAQKNELIEQLARFSILPRQIVEQLSGGQQQILAILLILSHQVEILLLDEPTAALDVENRNLVLTFLTELAQKKECLILMVTHDQELLKNQESSSIHFI